MTDQYDHIRSLQGLTWWQSVWTRPRAEWDHDHCSACWAKFSDGDGLDTLHEGYTTGDDYKHGARYEWVCDECFAKLKEKLSWSIGSSNSQAAKP